MQKVNKKQQFDRGRTFPTIVVANIAIWRIMSSNCVRLGTSMLIGVIRKAAPPTHLRFLLVPGPQRGATVLVRRHFALGLDHC